MANFAAAMMRAMSEINFEDMDIVENASDHFKLRVGISAGPVIAGKLTLNNGTLSNLIEDACSLFDRTSFGNFWLL